MSDVGDGQATKTNPRKANTWIVSRFPGDTGVATSRVDRLFIIIDHVSVIQVGSDYHHLKMRILRSSIINKVWKLPPSGGDHNDQLLVAILDAVSVIRRCGVIAVPTDTIYGIACDANNRDSINELYDIKQRDPLKPVAISVGDIDDVYKWCNVTVSRDVLESLLPGQVTLVFNRLPALNPSLNPGNPLIGVRIPNSNFIREVCRRCQTPLALTSANISSTPSCLSIEEFRDLWPQIDRVYDGGSLLQFDPNRLGSTVIDLSIQGSFSIIRTGCAFHLVLEVMKKFGIVSETK